MQDHQEYGKYRRIVARALFAVIMCCVGCLALSGCRKKSQEGILLTPMSAEELQGEELQVGESDTLSPQTGTGIAQEAATVAVSVEPEPVVPATILVHVCGAVVREGVYELPDNSRVVDAIEAAGGLTGEADGEAVNQASILQDGMRIRIPTLDERDMTDSAPDRAAITVGSEGVDMADTPVQAGGGASGAGLININTASVDELVQLPGIGKARAQKIIAYREQYGGFAVIEDIMNVSGIKEKAFAQIKDMITV